MTRIAIISDVHCHTKRLKTFLKKESSDADVILCAGDIVGYRYEVDETIELFEKYQIQSIKGNHDQYAIDQIEPSISRRSLFESIETTKKHLSRDAYRYLEKLPDTLQFKTHNIYIELSHGNLTDSEIYIYRDDWISILSGETKKLYEKNRYYFVGHTHRPFYVKCCDRIVVNSGSIGFPKNNNPPSYIVFDDHVLSNCRALHHEITRYL